MKRVISVFLSAALMIMLLQGLSVAHCKAVDIPVGNYVISENQKFVKDHKDDYADDYLKITPQSSGIMTITFTGATFDIDNKIVAHPYLKDSKKNILESDICETGTCSIPVKKGEVYYLSVLCSGTQYSVIYNIKKLKTFSKATSRKKAPTLKKNKTVNGVMFYSDKKKDAKWYKINVKKKSKIKVTMKLKGEGFDYDIFLYNKKGKKIKWSLDSTNKKYAKLKKGTYYIKVGKISNIEGADFPVYGTYTLKWK